MLVNLWAAESGHQPLLPPGQQAQQAAAGHGSEKRGGGSSSAAAAAAASLSGLGGGAKGLARRPPATPHPTPSASSSSVAGLAAPAGGGGSGAAGPSTASAGAAAGGEEEGSLPGGAGPADSAPGVTNSLVLALAKQASLLLPSHFVCASQCCCCVLRHGADSVQGCLHIDQAPLTPLCCRQRCVTATWEPCYRPTGGRTAAQSRTTPRLHCCGGLSMRYRCVLVQQKVITCVLSP